MPKAPTAKASELVDQTIESVPRHIAIIMDGNNRWARRRLLPGPAGHKAGVEAIRTVLETLEDYPVEVLTLFAFSSENWKRPSREVSALMALFLSYLEREVSELNRKGVRVRVIGDRHRFSSKLQERIDWAEQVTAANTRTTLVIAADYGGRRDITQAAQALARQVLEGRISPEQIDERLFAQQVQLHEFPPPDLLIRTGGEHRISNFMLWQFAYTELYFTDVYWPDFGAGELIEAMRSYSGRQRRFGGRNNDEAGEAGA